ncbi:sensor histidine kinase [Streptomyces spectabilis]|uniref:histidine kinase n=2 Tax=Streptomyces spectabilis TaxID=68270 RepID=A0A7W8AQS7_STRST|nr:HAMP domain-containing sensor histidine kinase [Streptomyces spectabilis]MBB5102919.1 signal transduction histidine kinase [Streptomyces spectabilis]MCI3902120.1 HAMP domain-containing histidine kinase [Streptomyces spectabilis]GGV15874.1 two-component sensor histidine kinase [Streptomyces spectabilis]
MARDTVRDRRSLLRFVDPRSLRWKIAAGVAAAACAMAVGIGVLVHQRTEERGLGIGRAAALRELDLAKAEFRGEQPTRRDPGERSNYVVGDEVPTPLRDRLASATSSTVTWRDTSKPLQGPSMWAATRVDGTVIAVSVSMLGEQLSLEALDRHIRYAAIAMLAVVVPLTLLAAELVLRRLRRVAGTARRIRHGDLDARTEGRGHDEISEISSAVDHMADALQERLRGEQRFTADVAHELRTPLTGLVTSASLLPESEATELVRDRVRVLRGLVDDLLEISRLDAGAERADTQPVPLGELVAESVRRVGLEEHVTVTVVGRPVAETDPRRLDRIVTNLVLNAHRHGGAPVEVTVDAATVVVRDHGPGFPEDLLRHGPQRFHTATPERGHGHGLGLTIALGQSHVIAATLTLTNATPHGAVATLTLPSPA